MRSSAGDLTLSVWRTGAGRGWGGLHPIAYRNSATLQSIDLTGLSIANDRIALPRSRLPMSNVLNRYIKNAIATYKANVDRLTFFI